MSRTEVRSDSDKSAPLVDTRTLCGAVATGDLKLVRQLVEEGGKDVNHYSPDGFAPLCIASFWGYADITQYLLERGADVNLPNKGTGWTPCHCAAYQGQGKCLLRLMQYKPDLRVVDAMGRMAADFASALDSIWPFFAAQGCTRTPKKELIEMRIIQKLEEQESASDAKQSACDARETRLSRFSRPGSSYILATQSMTQKPLAKVSQAALYGDVLAEEVPS